MTALLKRATLSVLDADGVGSGRRKIQLLLLSLFLLAFPVLSSAAGVTGRWQAKVMGSTISADIRQDGLNISGVARVYNPIGKKDVFHFNGSVSENRLSARHSSGHRFDGLIVSANAISGTLTTKDGRKLPVKMIRR